MKRATVMLTELDYKIYISIHALVKRATVHSPGLWILPHLISIHALAKRATRYHSITDTVYRYFNPRPRKEGDITPFLYKYSTKGFQSTPSQRGRLQLISKMFHEDQFQSTPSQRGRPDKVYTLKRNI